MEENPDNQMETDVSSTTQDILPLQEESGPTSSVEVTVEIAEAKEEMEEETEQDQNINSNITDIKSPYKAEEVSSNTESLPVSTKDQIPIIEITKEILKPVEIQNDDSSVEITVPSSSTSGIEELNEPSSETNNVNSSNSTSDPTEKLENNDTMVAITTEDIVEDLENQSQTSSNHIENINFQGKEDIDVEEKEDVNVEEKEDINVEEKEDVTVEEKEDVNVEEKEEIIVIVPIDIQSEKESNDSQDTVSSAADSSEKDHNKSINRELKSLIDSAKESKIINECTQLKNKTRKSRTPASNTPEKILGVRRESNNSQISNSSDKTEKFSQKRSMRSQNPEFVTKHKQFLNTVTAKYHKDQGGNQEAVNADPDTSKKADNTPNSLKRKKALEERIIRVDKLSVDPYCWHCHWSIEEEINQKNALGHCTTCPRSYHFKCLNNAERQKLQSEKKWVCPKCTQIAQAEDPDTKPQSLKNISSYMLNELLRYAMTRMVEINGVDAFMGPVDRKQFSDYDKYVIYPMDLNRMKLKNTSGQYRSTEAFYADAQWILHNSIIFNTLQSKLTNTARALVRLCRTEIGEIEACPECYAGAHQRKPTWFTDVCSVPHILLWAKLKGFPYWPAKGMSVNNGGMVDVRFFGAHDRAWVPAKDCFLYSEADPNKAKRLDISDSMLEAEQYIRNISRKFGKFVYPAFKVQFDPSKLKEQLKLMIPAFDLDCTEKNTSSTKTPKSKPGPKSSKTGENGDDTVPPEKKRKTTNGDEISVNNKTSSNKNRAKSVEPNTSEKGKVISRKRRRSALEEAVITVMVPSIEKRVRSTPDKQQQTKNEPNKTDSTSKPKEKKAIDKVLTTPKSQKDPPKIAPKVTSTPTSTSNESNKLVPKERSNTVPICKVDERKKIKVVKRNKSLSSEKDEKTKKKDKTKVNKSLTRTPKSRAKSTESNNSSNKSKNSKSLKDNIVFDDDDTSLAILAKKTNEPQLPTISNVRSLSQTDVSKENMPENNKGKEHSLVGRVGVRAFARMTSPSKDSTVEVKPEPMDYEDAERQSQKIDFANTIHLRPVNSQATNLREVRINKVVPTNAMSPIISIQTHKTVEVRPRARKTFPQPPKPVEGRSELNGKNSMVYIPIQPPMTQAPVRQPSKSNGPVTTTAAVVLRTQNVVNSSSNTFLSTSTTPQMTIVSSSTSTSCPPLISTVGSLNSLVGQIPSMGGQVPGVGGQLPGVPGQISTVGSSSNALHTVPLITSVNGQWTFSLQPMMSVGSVENSRLQKQPLLNPFDPKCLPSQPLVPSSAGHITAKINQNAAKLTQFFRTILEDSIEHIDVPGAKAASLQLRLEETQWKHKQEIEELKHNHLLIVKEMRASFEKEKVALITENRRKSTADLNAIRQAKTRQWCANCFLEARLFCCWNTSYCDYGCQRDHWEQHFQNCYQYKAKQITNGESVDLTEDEVKVPETLPVLYRPMAATASTCLNAVKTVQSNITPMKNTNKPQGAKPSIIVSMVDDGGNSTVKCVGTFKPGVSNTSTSLLVNNQLKSKDDGSKKVVTSGGYLIVGASSSGNPSVVIN